jgi:prevent-host-death family protein
VSEIVRRARAGERMLITVNGVPAAQIGPVADMPMTLADLISGGLLRPPRTRHEPPPKPARLAKGVTSESILSELRSR